MTGRMERLGSLLEEAARLACSMRESLSRELKEDGSVVTEVDRSVERWLRPRLREWMPAMAIWGEEGEFEPPTDAGQWQIDPIDGTSNFSFGSPLWGVTVSLLEGDEMTLGGIILPDLNETYLVDRGEGAYRNGARLGALAPGPIRPEELVSVCEYVLIPYGRGWIPGKIRCAGAFVVDGAFVASGRYRALVGMRERLYDVGSSLALAAELGAEARYVDGRPLEPRRLAGGYRFDAPWIIAPTGSGFPTVALKRAAGPD